MFILGGSRADLGKDNANCIPQIANGLMYIRDRKWPSIVQASGVWNQYLQNQNERRLQNIHSFDLYSYNYLTQKKSTKLFKRRKRSKEVLQFSPTEQNVY